MGSYPCRSKREKNDYAIVEQDLGRREMSDPQLRKEILDYAELIQEVFTATSVTVIALINGRMVVVDTSLEKERECLTE